MTKLAKIHFVPIESNDELNSLGSTPIKLDILQQSLEHYPSEDAKILVEGFKYGFKIPFKGQRGFAFSRNHGSAVHNSDIINKKLMNEMELG